MTADSSATRARLIAQRRALDNAFIVASSDALAAHAGKCRFLRRAKRIAGYVASNGEIDCQPLLEQLILRKKEIFLPVVAKKNLFFAPFRSGTELQPNNYGILEPVYQKCELLPPAHLDAVFAPLVAFDEKLSRIGMGGGFYDRCFAFRRRRGNWRKPLLIGVAYDFQRVELIAQQPWDVPLDAVITEKQRYGSC